MQAKGRRLHFFPNIITAFGLACGLFVILKVNMVSEEGGTFQVLNSSALLLLLAALADVLDGAVARIFRAESDFGTMFDSLSDAITFGVAPPVLLLSSLDLEPGTGSSFFALIGALLFSLCGVLRLVRFNVKAYAVKGDEKALAAHKQHFIGLPIPAAALAAVAAYLLLSTPYASDWLGWSSFTKTVVMTSITIVLAYFMVSRWKFPSMKTLRVRVISFQVLLVTVFGVLFLLYGILYFFPVIFVILTWGYIFLGWILSMIRIIAGKKSKTLVDFEPANDDFEDFTEEE